MKNKKDKFKYARDCYAKINKKELYNGNTGSSTISEVLI